MGVNSMPYNNNGKLWSGCEDAIIILLRPKNLSIRDISSGLFGRSRSSTASRIETLRRKKKVL